MFVTDNNMRFPLAFFFFIPLCVEQNGADVKWVDGGKAIFKVSTNVVSTVYTQVRTNSVY